MEEHLGYWDVAESILVAFRLRASVNNALGDAPNPSGWHHKWCRPVEEKRGLLARRRTSMSAEENMALVRRFWEARVVKRDLDAVDEMLAPDFVNHSNLVTRQEPDREDYLQGIAAYHAALSEGRLIIDDQVAAGDKVVTRFTVHTTHDRGELLGVAPTGRDLTNRAIIIHRISEGKIAEEWGLGTIGLKLRGQRLEQEIRQRERVEQELGVARRIQQASLPGEVPELEG